MSKEHVDEFRTNIERYFEGTDPRNRGRAGTAVGGLDHQQYRKFGDFRFYRYREGDKSKGKLGGSPAGNYTGIGLDINRTESIVLLSRPDVKDVLFRWNYFKIGEVFEGTGFENELNDTETEMAVDLSLNPILFTEFQIFTGITDEQKVELSAERERYRISTEKLQKDLQDINDAQRNAWISARDIIIG